MKKKNISHPQETLKPDPEFIAQQLRKPSGDFAAEIAEVMNRVNHPLSELTLENMNVADGDRIMEIGFANGKFFNDLLSKADRLNVHGIDLSEEMVQQAKVQNAAAVASGRLSLHLASSEKLPFDNNSFDKVFCNMVIYFWDNPEKHLQEVYRVLRTEGIFYTGFRPRESMLQFPFVKHGFILYDVEEWTSILEKTGFTVTEIARKTDPEMENNGKTIRLESVCIVAEKQT